MCAAGSPPQSKEPRKPVCDSTFCRVIFMRANTKKSMYSDNGGHKGMDGGVGVGRCTVRHLHRQAAVKRLIVAYLTGDN